MSKNTDGAISSLDLEIAEQVAGFYDDPLGFVQWAFDWGYGELESFDGPDKWQSDVMTAVSEEILKDPFDGHTPVSPRQIAVSSGHGPGKSALSAWLILWLMSTRPYCKGVVTANTSDQLRTKTWAELSKWKKLCVTGHWFEYNNSRGNMSLYHRSDPENWRVDAQTCREENSEAFAGLHAAHSSPWYLFDEACHDDMTEVMTDMGWVRFEDVTPDHRVLAMDPHTRHCRYETPTHLHIHQHNGPMLRCEARGIDYCVTPNHRMLSYTRKKPDTPRFIEAQDMVWSNARMSRSVNWSPTVHGPILLSLDTPVEVDEILWARFLGWYVTEGSITYNSKGCKRYPSGVMLYQHQPHHRDEIAVLVERLPFSHRVRDDGVMIHSSALARYLLSFGDSQLSRRVPRDLLNRSPEVIREFLDAAVKGDGYVKKSRKMLYTSSRGLAGDYQEAVLKAGGVAHVNARELKPSYLKDEDRYIVPNATTGYVVSWLDRQTAIDATAAKPEEVHYEGKVYCLTVPSGTLLTRRNGKVMWSGNSAVPNKIWEVAEGGKTDGEPFHFVFGNPTRKDGAFFECFNKQKHRWRTFRVDSREAKMTNKDQIAKWEEDWGEDSDFFRVRVKGEFPKASDLQFIPHDLVTLAARREPRSLDDDLLVCGIDVARGGADDNMIQFRKGQDAKSFKAYRIPGEETRDTARFISLVTDILSRMKPDVICIDATGIGGPMGDRLRQLGFDVYDIHFGGDALNKGQFRNRASEMWYRMRQWLINGGAIKDHPELKDQLTGRLFDHDDKDRLVLERKKDMRKRGLASPDWADALALTFAVNTLPKTVQSPTPRTTTYKGWDYNPLDNL